MPPTEQHVVDNHPQSPSPWFTWLLYRPHIVVLIVVEGELLNFCVPIDPRCKLEAIDLPLLFCALILMDTSCTFLAEDYTWRSISWVEMSLISEQAPIPEAVG